MPDTAPCVAAPAKDAEVRMLRAMLERLASEALASLLVDAPELADEARAFACAPQEALLRLRFSAGVVVCQGGEEVATALARADAALYRAKRAGKDRVIVD